jgi:hypothetical protein
VSGWKLTWNGPEILGRISEAKLDAMAEVANKCVQDVRGQRTGRLASAVEARPVTVDGERAGVQWGYFPEPAGGALFFELFRETGTAVIAGDNAKRNAMDRHYPDLPRSIRRKAGY